MTKMEGLNDYISVYEAAEYYGKSTQHIYNMIKSNTIPAVRFNRGRMMGWLVQKPVDYAQWLNNKENEK